jgi:hypothetical protein
MKRLRGVSERHFVFEVGVEEQNGWTWEGTVRRLGPGGGEGYTKIRLYNDCIFYKQGVLLDGRDL